jgi:hypothetical protein
VTTPPDIGHYRRATAAALIAAPALLLLDNILHPKEFERDNEARQLTEIAQHAGRWQLAHALGFLAILIFAVAVLGLAFLVRRHRPRLGLVAGALGLLGLMSFAAAITLDGYTWGTLGDVFDNRGVAPSTVEIALHEVQQSGWSLVYYLPAVGFIVGLPMLAISLGRQGVVPIGAATLLALGAVLSALEPVVISNAYFIATSAVLLAGGIAVGIAISRMSVEEFALGGR